MTPAMKETLDFVTSYYREKGISPSLDEIAAARGLHSKSAISKVVNALVARGHLLRSRGFHRSIVPADELQRFTTLQLRAEIDRREATSGKA